MIGSFIKGIIGKLTDFIGVPYVIGENGEQPGYTFLTDKDDFYNELDYLLSHVEKRHEAVLEYLEGN